MTARRIRLPYTLALVLAGLVLSFINLEALAGLTRCHDVVTLS